MNHLFNIDNVKTFAKDDKQQKDLLIIIKTFINNMKMEFGSEKYIKATFKRGNLSTQDICVHSDREREMKANKYKAIIKDRKEVHCQHSNTI